MDANFQSVVNSKSKFEPDTDIFSLHKEQPFILEILSTAQVIYWEGLFSNLVWSFRYSVFFLYAYFSLLGATSNERRILIT